MIKQDRCSDCLWTVMLCHLQNVVDTEWSNEDSDGMEACHLETLYRVPWYIQYAVLALWERHGVRHSFFPYPRSLFPIDRVSVSPCQRPLWQTVCWFHTDGCYTVQPRWTCAPESLAPWALWRTWSGNLCHPPRSLSVAVLCLKIRIYTDSGKEIKYLSVQYPAHEHLSAHISLKH